MNNEDFDPASGHHIKLFRGEANRAHQRTHIEDLPKRVSHSKLSKDYYGHGSGWRFSGLPGMLRKGVGRPWSKVHSEIVAYVKKHYVRDLWGQVLGNLDWYVELHPMHIGDGIYMDAIGHPLYGFRGHAKYYVHPNNGLLLEPKAAWRNIRMEKPRREGECRNWHSDPVYYFSNRMFRCINGHWYEVEVVNLPNPPADDWKNDFNYAYRRNRENNWLWKLNLYDAVMKIRLFSHVTNQLAECHGYRTYQNKLMSRETYNEKAAQGLRSPWYQGGNYIMLSNHYIYAKSIRMISKAEMRGIGLVKNLKLPNIVR